MSEMPAAHASSPPRFFLLSRGSHETLGAEASGEGRVEAARPRGVGSDRSGAARRQTATGSSARSPSSTTKDLLSMPRFRLALLLLATLADWLGAPAIRYSLSIAKLAFFVVYAGFFLLLAFELFRRTRPAP